MRSSHHLKSVKFLNANKKSISLSIIIDDFDSKSSTKHECAINSINPESVARIAIEEHKESPVKKILEEQEERKLEFSKLLDEHKEVIENLKKIKRLQRFNARSMSSGAVL